MSIAKVVMAALLAVALGQAGQGLSLASPPAPAEIIYVFDRDYPPFSFLEAGRPAGMEVEIMAALAQALGLKMVARPLPWDEAQSQIQGGLAQVISGLTSTPERRHYYRFLEPPNATLRSVVYARQTGGVTTLDGLKGRRVAALRGSTQEIALRARPGVEVIAYDTEPRALQALARGEVEAFAGTDVTARRTIAQQGYQGLTPLPEPLGLSVLHFATAAGNDELARRLEAGLKDLRRSGAFDRIKAKWLGD